MPYIAKQCRERINPTIENLVAFLAELETEYSKDGAINYIITKLLLKGLKLEKYVDYERAIGLLEACKLEFYRRAVTKYEIKKCIENGDVY